MGRLKLTNYKVEIAPLGATNMKNEIEQTLEDKYGMLNKEVGSDEDGLFFVSESDSGNPSDEGYSIIKKKIRIDDCDIKLLEELNII